MERVTWFLVVEKAICWLPFVFAFNWLNRRLESWFTGLTGSMISASVVDLAPFAASLAVLYGLWLFLRPAGRMILDLASRLLVRSGPAFFLPLGVWHLLALSKPSDDAAGRDSVVPVGLHGTYRSLSTLRKREVLETLRQMEEWPSPIATKAHLFKQSVVGYARKS